MVALFRCSHTHYTISRLTEELAVYKSLLSFHIPVPCRGSVRLKMNGKRSEGKDERPDLNRTGQDRTEQMNGVRWEG
jgi:hypothetical protein